jgi:hypothetical protein
MVIKPSENTQLSSTRFPCIGHPIPNTKALLHYRPVSGLLIHDGSSTVFLYWVSQFTRCFFCLHSCAAAECRISKPCNCYPQDKRMQRNSPSDMTKSLHKMLSSLFILPRHLPHKCLERYKHESPSARCLVIHDCSSMIFLYWVSQCTKIRYSHLASQCYICSYCLCSL